MIVADPFVEHFTSSGSSTARVASEGLSTSVAALNNLALVQETGGETERAI